MWLVVTNGKLLAGALISVFTLYAPLGRKQGLSIWSHISHHRLCGGAHNKETSSQTQRC